jgi:outer membrane protein
LTTSLFSLCFILTLLLAVPAGSRADLIPGVAAPTATAPIPPSSTTTKTTVGSTVVPSAGQEVSGNRPVSLTLDQVVNIAVASNTNVVLAKERLAEAAEGINQIDAQGKPQLGSNVADTYSTFAESVAAFGPVVSNPVVPTGTTIPTITDEAADFSTTFGVGTAAAKMSAFGAGTGAPVGDSGTMGTDNSTAPTAGPSSSSTAPAASTPITAPTSTPDYGAGTTSSPDASPSTSGTSYPDLMPMPLILQNYVTEKSAPSVVADNAQDDVAQTDPMSTAESARNVNAKGSSAAKTAASEVGSAGTTRHTDQGNSSTPSTNSTTVNSGVSNDQVNNYGARVNLSQYIDAFGLLGAAKRAEQLTRDFYAIDIDRTQNEVALSAKNLFFNVILAQQEVATEQEQVTDSQESVRVTAALVQQGQAAGFDLLSVQTTLANNEQLLTSVQNALSFAQADLDYLLGVNPNTVVNLVAPPLPPLDETIDLQQSTNVALQRRPEIIQANRNVQLAQKLVKVATEGTTPTLGFVGTYGYNSTSTATVPTNEGLISAQLQIPFDDGGATRSRVREAKDVLLSQITTKNELQLNVELEVRQAYLNVLDGQTQASTAHTGVNLALETLRVANVQYQNGVGTILDVENAQAELATARTNLANAQYTYQTSLAALVRDIGSR